MKISASFGLQRTHRVASASVIGHLQPRQLNVFTANIMIPPLRAVGVGLQMVRVWSPLSSD